MSALWMKRLPGREDRRWLMIGVCVTLLLAEAFLPGPLAQRGISILFYIGAAVLLVAAQSRPWLGLALLLAYGPFAAAVRFGGASNVETLLKDVFALGLVALWLIRWLGQRRGWVHTALDLPIAAFVFLMAVQVLAGPLILRGILALKILATYIPIYFLVTNNPPTRVQIQRVLWLVLAVAAVTATYGLYQYSVWGDQGGLTLQVEGQSYLASTRLGQIRVFSTFTHSIVFSLYLSLMLTLGLALLPMTRAWRRALLLVIIGLLVAVMPLTLSRIGWIGSAIGIGTLVLLGIKPGERLRLIAFGVLAVALFLLVAAPATRETLDWSFTENDLSYQQRQLFMDWSYRTLLTEVPLGCGMGVLPDSADLAARLTRSPQMPYLCVVSEGRFMQSADTVALAVGAQTGILGYLLFAWITVGLLVGGWRAYRRLRDPWLRRLAAGLLGWMAIMAFSNFFSSSTQAYPVVDLYFWFFAGLLMSLERVEQRGLQLASQVT